MLGQQRAALALLVAAAAVAVAAQGSSAQPPPPPPAHQAADSAEASGSSEAGSSARPKRYVAALARNGDLPFSVRREWHKKLHPAMSAHRGLQAALQPGPNAFGIPGKRYVGALARGGALPGKRVNYAGDDFQDDDPVDWEMERLLREELQALEELQAAEQVLQRLQASEDKRSLASLARGGQLPGKRAASADKGMDGDAGADSGPEEDDEWKRGISTLAKNGQLPAPLTPGDNRSAEEEQAAALGDEAAAEQSKRGGVAALARLGYLPPHKKDLDWLLTSLQAPPPDKRYVGALARQYGLPPPGKRNLGSLARGGGLSALRYAGAKKSDLLDGEQQKRSATSRLQNGLAPLGKRVPAFWHVPQQYRPGKRFFGGGEEGPEEWSLADAGGPEEVAKRYVAALLRQGRLPVGGAGASYASPFSSFADADADERDDAEPLDEEKRHIGALRRISRAADAQDEAETEAEGEVRAKRTASDELALPVLQPDEADGDDAAALLQRTLYVGDDAAPADKRFLGPPPAPFEDGAAPVAPRRQQPWADAAVAKRHIGALARLGWLPAFHAGTQGERYGRGGGRARFGKRDREDPADEPRAAARAAGERASGAAAFPQHLSAATHAIRRLLERRHELLQLQRYNRIHLPHVVRR